MAPNATAPYPVAVLSRPEATAPGLPEMLSAATNAGVPPAGIAAIRPVTWPRFTASVAPVPAATLTIRRSEPTAPTETVFA